jgi:hypothetical protein
VEKKLKYPSNQMVQDQCIAGTVTKNENPRDFSKRNEKFTFIVLPKSFLFFIPLLCLINALNT